MGQETIVFDLTSLLGGVFIPMVLSLATTWLVMWVMTAWGPIQGIIVPYFDEYRDMVSQSYANFLGRRKRDPEAQLTDAEAQFAMSMAINIAARMVCAFLVFAVMYVFYQ